MIKKNIHLGDEPALCKLYVNRYHIVFASDVRSKIIETGGKGKMKKAEKITIKVLKVVERIARNTLLRKRDSGVILFMAVLMMNLFDCYFVVI